MNNFLFRAAFCLCMVSALFCKAQKTEKFNLSSLLKDKKLVFQSNQSVTELTDGNMQGITCNGIVWLKDITFSTGSIDVDIRGKDVFQQSFLGIAFHGTNATTYEAIYFRPFNFQTADAVREKHQVQYVSEPDYPWDRLRKEHPLMYENGVTPSLKPTEWFHAHIVIKNNEIIVYVNHASTPSLKVKRLNTRNTGKIALWTFGLSGDFANLVVRME